MPRKTIDEERFHKLRVAIRDKYKFIAELSEDVGLSIPMLSERLCGKTPWRMAEVYTVCKCLDVPASEIITYFPPEECKRAI